MGTRVDYYVGRGLEAEWLGSYPFDGYPEGIDAAVLNATTEAEYRAVVDVALNGDNATRPEQGWPWPWETSATTDFSYAFDGGKVWASCFGRAWFDPLSPQPTDEDGDPTYCDGPRTAVFPDMSARQAVTYGDRSGLIVFAMPSNAPRE